MDTQEQKAIKPCDEAPLELTSREIHAISLIDDYGFQNDNVFYYGLYEDIEALELTDDEY